MRSTGCCESGGLCGLTHLEGKVATGHPVDVGGELVRVAAILEREVCSARRASVLLHRDSHFAQVDTPVPRVIPNADSQG